MIESFYFTLNNIFFVSYHWGKDYFAFYAKCQRLLNILKMFLDHGKYSYQNIVALNLDYQYSNVMYQVMQFKLTMHVQQRSL